MFELLHGRRIQPAQCDAQPFPATNGLAHPVGGGYGEEPGYANQHSLFSAFIEEFRTNSAFEGRSLEYM